MKANSPEPPNYRTVPLDLFVRDFDVTLGELEQFQEWIRRCNDLLEESPGVLYTSPSLITLRRIRRRELITSLPPSPGPALRLPW